MAELTQEQKKQRTELITKVVVAGAICFAVAPVIFTVVQGLVGLIIAAGIGFTALQLTPWFAMRVANWRMRLIMAEASKNPIETMNNVYKENREIIAAKDQKIAQFEARLGDYKSKMTFFAKKYPDEVPQFQEVAEKMSLVLSRQKQKQRVAKAEAAAFHDEIVKAEAIYEMACAAHSVTELGGDVEKQVFQDIKRRVSFDAVTHRFNTAVAELSVEADTDPDAFLTDTRLAGALPESTEGTPVPGMQIPESIPMRRAR